MAIIKIGGAMHLAVADSPFNDVVEGFQLRLIVLTPAGADATLTLFAAKDSTDATKIIGVYIAKSGTSSLPIPFPVDPEVPRWAFPLTITLAGAGSTADIYLA